MKAKNIRHKRQVSDVPNCTLLKSELTALQDKIIVVQQNITSNTNVVNHLKDKISTYEQKVETTLNLAILNGYVNLYNIAFGKRDNLTAQLNDFNSQKIQMQSDIEKYCSITTTTSTTTSQSTQPPTMSTEPIDLSQINDVCGKLLIKIANFYFQI